MILHAAPNFCKTRGIIKPNTLVKLSRVSFNETDDFLSQVAIFFSPSPAALPLRFLSSSTFPAPAKLSIDGHVYNNFFFSFTPRILYKSFAEKKKSRIYQTWAKKPNNTYQFHTSSHQFYSLCRGSAPPRVGVTVTRSEPIGVV